MNRTPAPFSGILVIDKPQGFTSHDAVGKLRRLMNTRQIGHTGTLDPLATGVLPMLCGRAVKANEYLSEHDKAYTATFILGKTSETGDTDGTLSDTGAKIPSENDVLLAAAAMVGCRMQKPPMTSAIKVNGKKLVDYQRAGETVEVTVFVIVSASDFENTVFNIRRDAFMHRVGKLTELALSRHLLALDRDCYALDEFDGFFSDSRHGLLRLL